MRKLGGFTAAAVSLLGVSVASGLSVFPTNARSYRAFLVRAYDQCSPSGLSVVGATAAGCLANSTVTDDGATPTGATMRSALVTAQRFPTRVGGSGRITLLGRGFKVGQRVQVRLTLRTSQANRTVKHPGLTGQTVTFQDTTVVCGNQNSGCFVARPSGVIAGRELLKDCLTQSGSDPSLASGNVEFLDAALLNCDTGKIIGVPGILN